MIPGIDVSKWQADIDWLKVKHTGVCFAFIKASQGISHIDPFFSINWQAARAAGIIRGAYHYFHSRLDAEVQAESFYRLLSVDAGELPPVVDLEAPETSGSALMLALSRFLQKFEKLSGLRPMIYTSPGFWNSYVTPYPPEWPNNYPLWIAHYGVDRPSIPYPWLNFNFWQFSEKGEVAGITRFPSRRPKVDLNWFNGSQAELAGMRIA